MKTFIPANNIKSFRFKSQTEEYSVIYNKEKQLGEMTVYDSDGYQIARQDIKASPDQWVQYQEMVDRDSNKKIVSYNLV